MKSATSKLLLCLLGVAGGMLWIVCGIILSLRPAGDPPITYRHTVDLMPYLALGLLLTGISVSGAMLHLNVLKNRKVTIASFITFTGSLMYSIGRLIRHAFLGGTGWEPFLPLGFLVFLVAHYTWQP